MSIQSNFPAIAPTLNLSFALTKTLDPRVTFSRASTGTFYGTQTAKAEENLLLQSQDFDNAVWSTTRATISANSTTAPDGTTTADSLTQASGQTVAGLLQVTTNPSNIAAAYVFSVFAKPNGKNFIRLTIVDVGAGNVFRECYFNVSTGTVGTANNGAVGTISAVANGFYRCSIAYTFATASTISPRVFLADTDNSATVVDSGGVFLWGAQLEQRSAVTAYTATTTQPITNYISQLQTAASGVARFDHNPITDESLGLLIEEQRTNLVTYSEQFDNAAWTKTRASITANTIVAPDGTLTGDKLVEDTTASSTHVVYAADYSATNTTITASVYAKAAERSQFNFSVSNFATGGGGATFNLANGTFSAVTNAGDYTSTSASITPVGNGWYRCSITTTKGSFNSVNRWLIELNNGTSNVYTGNGYSGIFIWGAQLEVGAFPTSYIQTVASQVTRAADAASMTGTNFSSWYDQAQGTLYAEVAYFGGLIGTAIATNVIVIDDGTINNAINIRTVRDPSAPQADVQVTTNGVAQLDSGGLVPVVANTVYRRAIAYATNNAQPAINGGFDGGVDTSFIVPVTNRFAISSVNVGMYARKIAFYPLRVSNTNLAALTS